MSFIYINELLKSLNISEYVVMDTTQLCDFIE